VSLRKKLTGGSIPKGPKGTVDLQVDEKGDRKIKVEEVGCSGRITGK